jgi:hypothetical protein
MNKLSSIFIRSKHIDSFQKLRLLLFMQDHPNTKVTYDLCIERLYLGDNLLLEAIISDLQAVGLLVCVDDGWKLSSEPEIRRRLLDLASLFENPMSRQLLLKEIGVRSTSEVDYAAA